MSRFRIPVGTCVLLALMLIGATWVTGMPGNSSPNANGSLSVSDGSQASPSPIQFFNVTPNPTEVGVNGYLTVTVLGNITTGDTFAYYGLPPGCTSVNVSNLSCTPTSAGTFTVKVSVTNLLGVVQSSLNWTVHAALAVTITATAAASSTPLTIDFQGAVQGGATLQEITWNFGDGITATGPLDVNHTFSVAGTYAVTLRVADLLGASASANYNVTLSASAGTLVAMAGDNTTTGPAPLTVSFHGSASGGVAPYSFSWVFGDGASGSGSSPAHTYTTQGDFDAVLNVTDAASVSTRASVLVFVMPLAGTLFASITANVTVGTAPLSVSFQGEAQGGISPYTYLWSLGDGSASSSGSLVSHTYTTPGSFGTTLTVTDSNGVTATAHLSILVKSASGGLVVSASAVVPAGVAPFLASFTASASGGTAPYTFTWNFGDGSTEATGSVVAHVYVNAGTYLATVITADATGNVTTAHTQVTVTGSVAGTLSVSAVSTASSGVAPLTVDYNAAVSGGTGPYLYLWSFGDGSTSLRENPVFVYNMTGSYTACLVVTDTVGTTALSYVNVQVLASGQGLSVGTSYSVTATTNTSETVHFQSSVSGGAGPYTYVWSFDDGSAASSAPSPTHSFTSSGDFTVHLTVKDTVGASTTYALSLVVALSGLLVITSSMPASASSALTWSFQAAAAGGNGSYTYVWNFGDGSSTSAGAETVHTYASSGTFPVKVTVTDSQGHVSMHETMVTVLSSSSSPTPAVSYALLVVGGAVVVGAVVAVLVLRPRRATTPSRNLSREKTPFETSGRTTDADGPARTEVPSEEPDALSDMF